MLPLFLDWAAAEGQVRHLPTIQAGDQAVKVDLCTYERSQNLRKDYDIHSF